ncbi:hypothetical protein X975_06578, partial [Stegodyphus mimosarum]
FSSIQNLEKRSSGIIFICPSLYAESRSCPRMKTAVRQVYRTYKNHCTFKEKKIVRYNSI